MQARFLMCGSSGVTVEFGKEISEEINKKVRALDIGLAKSGMKGIVETIPTYRSLTIQYNPLEIKAEDLIGELKKLSDYLDKIQLPPAKVVEIPVLYGGEHGPDIEFVAKHANKTVEEVIEIHQRPEYLIYMLGFAPGFPYLGGMDSSIATPRLKMPRVKIPAGSVGIAGEQTGAYTVDSPGGWQLIGQTPVDLYKPNREKPILLEAGQYVKFVAINEAEFNRIKNKEKEGTYQCVVRKRRN